MISVVIISKDEPSLSETLADVTAQLAGLTEPGEIVVVDASNGRLDHIRLRYEDAVAWVDFQPPPGVKVSIPHQRNAGVGKAGGDIIVFTDAGCLLRPGWLEHLMTPLHKGETATAGVSLNQSGKVQYGLPSEFAELIYVREAPTLNLAFRREAFNAVGGFDESFTYGSDVDFTWRLNDAGYRILRVPDAVIEHDYGTPQRQRRRSFIYGKARARLYRKHRARRRTVLQNDPIAVLYPLFLLGLPITLVFPPYVLLLLVPAWRNRSEGSIRTLIDHLWFGAGVLVELAGG